MKVLQILKPSGMGGVEKIAADLHNYLISVKKEDAYIGISKEYIDVFKQSYNLVKEENIIPIDDKNLLNMRKSYTKIIKKINPDIVHTHARKECVFISTCKSNFRHIRTQHMEEHNRIPKTIFEKIITRKNVDKWVCTSSQLKNNYLKREGINLLKSTVIYNGVLNNKIDEYKGKIFDYEDKLCLGFVGRLNKQKGLDMLIDELSNIKNEYLNKIQLKVIGDGEEEETIKKQVKNSGLDKVVQFYGFKNDIINQIEKFDILVMPSRNEGLPLVLLESMSTGTPVAIHDVGCISEILSNGYNGWIIDNKENSWVDFIEDVISKKYDLENISKKALETYKSRFTLEKMCSSYYKEYKKILCKEINK